MSSVSKRRLAVSLSFAVFSFALTSLGEEPEKPPSPVREFLNQAVNQYELYSSEGRSKTSAKIALRWDNKERGRFEGLTAIWLDAHRPVAIASIYPWRSSLKHEFDLLSRAAGIVAKQGSTVVWQPAKHEVVEFRPIPKAGPPAETRRRRLLQIKRLAAEFQATLIGWKPDDSDREVLRMLPTPIHRYEPPSGANARLLDGAIFAFVKGIDPECVLLIEAHEHRREHRWEFAFVRQTSGSLQALHKKDVVWRVDKVIGQENNPSAGHFTVSMRLPTELRTR